jgi:hypothetical protein
MDTTLARPSASLRTDRPAATAATFHSADGSLRCIGCHLHTDKCMCGAGGRRVIDVLLGAHDGTAAQ